MPHLLLLLLLLVAAAPLLALAADASSFSSASADAPLGSDSCADDDDGSSSSSAATRTVSLMRDLVGGYVARREWVGLAAVVGGEGFPPTAPFVVRLPADAARTVVAAMGSTRASHDAWERSVGRLAEDEARNETSFFTYAEFDMLLQPQAREWGGFDERSGGEPGAWVEHRPEHESRFAEMADEAMCAGGRRRYAMWTVPYRTRVDQPRDVVRVLERTFGPGVRRGGDAWFMACPRVGASLHYDEADNVFVQLRGRKRVVLFPPDVSATALYVAPTGDPRHRQSLLRPLGLENVSLAEFPKLERAVGKALVVDVEANEAVFIPKQWAHWIVALEGPGTLSLALRADNGGQSVHMEPLRKVAIPAESEWDEPTTRAAVREMVRALMGDARTCDDYVVRWSKAYAGMPSSLLDSLDHPHQTRREESVVDVDPPTRDKIATFAQTIRARVSDVARPDARREASLLFQYTDDLVQFLLARFPRGNAGIIASMRSLSC